MTWSRKINLTAIKTPEAVAEKHFFDSMMAGVFLSDEADIIDIGSGGGFPGLVLQIMNPSLRLVLVDASRKKIHFITHVIHLLGLEGVRAVHARAESLHNRDGYRSRFDAAISRALADLGQFINLADPLLKEGGRIYAMKGRRAEAEITSDLARRYDFHTFFYHLPFEKADRRVIRLSAKQSQVPS